MGTKEKRKYKGHKQPALQGKSPQDIVKWNTICLKNNITVLTQGACSIQFAVRKTNPYLHTAIVKENEKYHKMSLG